MKFISLIIKGLFLLFALFLCLVAILYFTRESTLPIIQKELKKFPKASEAFDELLNKLAKIQGKDDLKTKTSDNPKIKSTNGSKSESIDSQLRQILSDKFFTKTKVSYVNTDNILDNYWYNKLNDSLHEKLPLEQIILDAIEGQQLLSLGKYCYSYIANNNFVGNQEITNEELKIIELYSILDFCNKSFLDVQKNIEFIRWLIRKKRFNKFISYSKEEDDLLKGFKILRILYAKDSTKSKLYSDLIIAFALVLDQKPLLLHKDIHSPSLAIDDVVQYYSYFKNLFEKKLSVIPYRKLSLNELMIIVDTPVPVSELKWALEKRKTYRNGKLYLKIPNDKQRSSNKEFLWKDVPYTLSNIKTRGGLDVDQVYAMTLIFRSFGIPTLFNWSLGSRGSHAWYSYKKPLEGKWVKNANRYRYDKNQASGITFSPQTRQQMTENQINLLFKKISLDVLNKKLRSDFISAALKKLNPKVAISACELSLETFSFDENIWNRLASLFITNNLKGDYDAMYDNKLKFFADDLEVTFKSLLELRTQYYLDKRFVDVRKVENKIMKITDDNKKYQYHYKYYLNKGYYAKNKVEEGRLNLENLFTKNIHNSDIYSYMIDYLDLTSQYNQQQEAMDFASRTFEILDATDFAYYFKQRAKSNLEQRK